jgi:hypothetical protein
MGKKQTSQEVVASDNTRAVRPDAKRRRFSTQSASVAGTLAAGSVAANAVAQEVPPWMKTMGTPMRAYGTPSKFESSVQRPFASGYATVTPGAVVAHAASIARRHNHAERPAFRAPSQWRA